MDGKFLFPEEKSPSGVLLGVLSGWRKDMYVEQLKTSLERRGQWYKQKPQAIGNLKRDERFGKLEDALVDFLKESPAVLKMKLTDGQVREMVRAGIQSSDNLKPDAPVKEMKVCVIAGICLYLINVFGNEEEVLKFIKADQPGKEKVFNSFMEKKFGAGMDYYKEMGDAASAIALSYRVFTNPSDANIRDLKKNHSSGLSMIGPYLFYMFTENERRRRKELGELIAEYEKKDGFA